MLAKLAWKNIWRNKLRSIVVLVTIALGVFAGVFLTGFMNGMIDSRINTIIKSEISHIQIHKPGFEDNFDFSIRMENADSVLQVVYQTENVSAASKRIVISSMAASSETSTGVKIIGIVPAEEKKVTNIYRKMVAGTYFESKNKNPVVIGKKLAEKLKVKVKNKIIITIQDNNKAITSGAFRVVGIFESENSMFDELNIFVDYQDICRLSGLNGTEAHEIAILQKKNDDTETIETVLKQKLPLLSIKGWLKISPESGFMVSAMNQYLYIFILIILFALCFSIINTMLMVVLERVREIGMLMAVGMSQIRVFSMIMLETIYLSLTGGIIGIISGYLFCEHFEKVGINLYFWTEAFESIGYSSIVYTTIDLRMLIMTTLMVILTGFLSSLYPAFKALRLNPAESTRI